MKFFFAQITILVFTFNFASAQIQPSESREKTEAKIRAWLNGMDDTGWNQWLIESRPQIKASNEKEFFKALSATGSGNGGDPLAMNFIDMAKYSISCGLLESLPEQKASILNRSFYSIKVFSVPFNLCIDDSQNCDFGTSFTAKNFSDKNVILVNAIKWNSISFQERVSIAMHEMLGILGIEEGTYGRSTAIKFKTIQQGNGSSFSTENYCWIE